MSMMSLRRGYGNWWNVWMELRPVCPDHLSMDMWKMLGNVMQCSKMGLAICYIILVQDVYWWHQTRVKTVLGTITGFIVRVGVHQDSSLCPYLFITLWNDVLTEEVDQARQCMLFLIQMLPTKIEEGEQYGGRPVEFFITNRCTSNWRDYFIGQWCEVALVYGLEWWASRGR